jgi:hypothetical protein
MTHASVPKIIIQLLRDNPAIAAAIGDRIHYQAIPQDSPLPHIYFTLQDESTDKCLDGSSGITEARYTFELIAESFDDVLVTSLLDSLEFDGGDFEGLTIFTSDVVTVSDDYQFRSARSDADFMFGATLTVYLCDQ